jgi:hypothetical protein
MFGTTTTPKRFQELLPRDHQRIDAMLTSILELVHVDRRPQLAEQWSAFEDAVLAHLDAEEMFMLPELSHHDPVRAGEIHDQHLTIRRLLAEVGIGIDLHVVREAQLERLASFLREHATSEERDFYRWADETLPQPALASVLRRLRSTWERRWAPKTAADKESPRRTNGRPVPPRGSS